MINRFYFKLHVGVESIRAPEILFQPSMIGSSEAGLAETIEYVLKLFTSIEQQQLVDNIFLTGGCAHFTGEFGMEIFSCTYFNYVFLQA